MTTDRRSKILARSLVAARIKFMLDVVHDRDPQLLERLRADAINEMKRWKSLVIKELEELPKSDCSIAGTYLANVTPPEIGIVRSISRARANFTALHEFGHHLQQTTPTLVNELGSQPDFGRALEEQTSDAFAARILLPEELVRKHLGAGTPTTTQIIGLHREGGASRAAVCVAVAQQLDSPGHVILLDGYGIIDFVASYMIEFPLRRGLSQAGTEIMNARSASMRPTVEAKTRFIYAGGGQGAELYAQAANFDPFTLILAVTDKAPWEKLSLSSTETAFVPRWHTCERCEHLFHATSLTRCEVCNQPKCPECEWCTCKARIKTKVCTNCFMDKSAWLFEPGSNVCKECAD